MNRTLTAWTAILIAASLLIQPLVAGAGAKDDIDRQIAEIRKQEQSSATTQKDADAKAQQLGLDKKQQIVIRTKLEADIKTQGKKLNKLDLKITDTSLKLQKTGNELESAEERVATRDNFLKARVRMLYMKGTVSYLEVLMDSTSFSDFINRFDSIKTLVGQDKKILTKNKKDRNSIADLKVNIEKNLVSVKNLYAEAETVRQSLKTKEKQAKVMIASLTSQQEAVEEVSEEQEANLITLAKHKQKLYSDKNEIIAKEKRAREAEARRLAAIKARKSQYAAPASAGDGELLWPVPVSDTLTSYFGYRIDPIKGYKKLHKGVDIGAPRATNIVAAESGTVLIASWVSGYGNCIVIDHGDGMWTWYGHIMEGGIYVSEGDSVNRGQVIAGIGSTGDSTGNHLHFEVRINESPVNPLPYIQ